MSLATASPRIALAAIERQHGVGYGFAPVFSTDPIAFLAGIHGADECLDVADLVEMAEFHLELIATGFARVMARDPRGVYMLYAWRP